VVDAYPLEREEGNHEPLGIGDEVGDHRPSQDDVQAGEGGGARPLEIIERPPKRSIAGVLENSITDEDKAQQGHRQ
jgi:hypothetical protein